MWEILHRRVPWKGMLPAQIICGVAFNGMRLPIAEDVDGRHISPDMRKLMQDCWLEDPGLRPSFDDIRARLKPLMLAATAEEKDEINEMAGR